MKKIIISIIAHLYAISSMCGFCLFYLLAWFGLGLPDTYWHLVIPTTLGVVTWLGLYRIPRIIYRRKDIADTASHEEKEGET